MADFETETELNVVVNDSSLATARREIESDLGDIAVDVGGTPSNMVGDGGVGPVGGTSPSESLSVSRGTNSRLDDNLVLNEDRNMILRDILDELEGGGVGGGEGPLPNIPFGGALAGLAGLGGVLAAVLANELSSVDFSQLIGDAVPDFAPSDFIDPVAVTASDLIDTGVSLAAGDLIDAAVDLTLADLLGRGFPLSIGNLLSSPFPIGVGALLGAAFPLSPSDIFDPGGGGGGDSAPTSGPSGGGPSGDGLLALAAGLGGGVGLKALLGGGGGGAAGGLAGSAGGSVTLATLAPLLGGAAAVGGAGLGALALTDLLDGGPDIRPPGRDEMTPQSGVNRSEATRIPESQVDINSDVDISVEQQQEVRREVRRELDSLRDDILREVERQLSGGR